MGHSEGDGHVRKAAHHSAAHTDPSLECGRLRPAGWCPTGRARAGALASQSGPRRATRQRSHEAFGPLNLVDLVFGDVEIGGVVTETRARDQL